VPHQQAGHMAAPTSLAPPSKKTLANGEPSTHGTKRPFFLAVRCAAPQLLQAGNGAVIAIASMYGLVGQYERVAYCGAKAGMIGMVRGMALDIADRRTGTCA
jgi:NAD(P)-dependent dehydrogenase (short-subunit alcohol dehydrogenase family)